jgi:glycosyltransferase involved in cell wall biosynthesis
VRIATYNNAKLLTERTLASVLRQTYERWEAVVVGDACDDDTEERIRALGDSRIRFRNLPVRGPYPADEKQRWHVAGTAPANAGLDAARGAWIAPLDHDDEFADDHIEQLLQAARATRAELVYGKLALLHEQTGVLLDHQVGAWPPQYGQFGFQAALFHAGLRRFRYDANIRFLDEPGDWNMARRWWEMGVRFHFVDRVVGTIHYVPKEPWAHAWSAEQVRQLRAAGRLPGEEAALPPTSDDADALRAEVERLRTTLGAIEGSASWRLTAPLRAVKRRLGSRRP